MRRWLSEFVAGLGPDAPDGPVCATPGCAERVRQRGARCIRHRGLWDRERRRLAEQERRRARARRDGARSIQFGFGAVVQSSGDSPGPKARTRSTTTPGPAVVVGLEPATSPTIPPAVRCWRACHTPATDRT
jgi:hypothetical protein